MKKICILMILSIFMSLCLTVSASEAVPVVPAVQALQMLADGNNRFVTEKLAIRNIGGERVKELSKGQHPFAVIVSCSDSRVPPELIFDQGLGDLFVVRTAGEVVDDIALGSIEYAVEHLGVSTVVVLGHGACGAVKATIAGGEAPGHIPAIVKAIQPAVDKAKSQKGSVEENAIKNNVDLITANLSNSVLFKELVRAGKLTIKGAVYDINTGKVAFQ